MSLIQLWKFKKWETRLFKMPRLETPRLETRQSQTRHFKKPRFHVLNFKSWIKLIYDTVDACNFVINEFNPTFEVQNMGNEAFQNALF